MITKNIVKEILVMKELLIQQENELMFKVSDEFKKRREEDIKNRNIYEKSLTEEDKNKMLEVAPLFLKEGFETYDNEFYEKFINYNDDLRVHTVWQYLPKNNRVIIEHCSCIVACCGSVFGEFDLDFNVLHKKLEEYWKED